MTVQSRKFLAVAALATALSAPALSAHAQGANPLNSITTCDAPGNQQRNSALIGAAIGALGGAAVAGDDDRGIGAVLGGALGAAAGSYMGCQQQRNQAQVYDTNTYAYGQNTYANEVRSVNGVRLARGVQPAQFDVVNDQLIAVSSVNLRAGPSTSSARVGQLSNGQSVQAIARVRNSQWILVGQNGVGVGYVNANYVQLASDSRYAGGYGYEQPRYDDRYDDRYGYQGGNQGGYQNGYGY